MEAHELPAYFADEIERLQNKVQKMKRDNSTNEQLICAYEYRIELFQELLKRPLNSKSCKKLLYGN